jgi:hypothetical protein
MGAGTNSSRPWRQLIAASAACAVAAQTLLVALAGLSLAAAKAADTAPAFELCLHDATGVPRPPTDGPDQSGCNHCIFCFAGSHHPLAAPPALFHRLDFDIAIVRWASEIATATCRPACSIANARGPPLCA